MAGSGHHTPTVDPALILAIRTEIDAAMKPVIDKLDDMAERLAAGDTRFALQEARDAAQDARIKIIEDRCQQHQALMRRGGKHPAEADTEKLGKKEMNPIVLAIITAAIAGPVGALAVFLLKGAAETAK